MSKHFRLAAPSCVLPAHIAPNCEALASEVREIGLMLLETSGCLAYSSEDLPASLTKMGLTFHAHLPVDLPWQSGVAHVKSVLCALYDKVAFLKPWGYVLHPPELAYLASLCTAEPERACLLCLENTHAGDLVELWPLIREYGLGVCLDVGHLVSYRQWNMLKLPGFFEHVRIMHVYGGEEKSGHLGLEHCDPVLLNDLLLAGCPRVLVVELFSWDTWIQSLRLLQSWLTQWGMTFD